MLLPNGGLGGALKRRSPQLDEPGIAPTAYTRLLQKRLWNAVKSEMFPDGSARLRGKGREVGFREVNAISALPEGPRTCGGNEAGLMLIAEKICEKLLPAGGELPVITEDNFTIIDKNDRATRRLGELVEAMIDPLWQRRRRHIGLRCLDTEVSKNRCQELIQMLFMRHVG